MRRPRMASRIERRLLVNWRADPDVIAPLLPDPFRPQVLRGRAVVGVCVLELTGLRPAGLPEWVGVRTQSAAHRVAVVWDEDGRDRAGVYVLRRETSSRLARWAGGRAFPGVLGAARFEADDADDPRDHLRVAYTTSDGVAVDVAGSISPRLDSDLFTDLDKASAFFRGGSVGYSPCRNGCTVEGIALQSADWSMEPVALEHAHSSFWDDHHRFPAGSVQLDSALLMRDLAVHWTPAGPVQRSRNSATLVRNRS